MNVIESLKRFLGFGPDDEEYVDSPQTSPDKPSMADTTDGNIAASPEMVRMIFDKVVEVTNTAVPAYLSSALNPELQKQYLYDSLDASIKNYIASLERAAHDKCMALWQKERDDLRHEADNLKIRARELETKKSEMSEQNLSSERQKRALAERVHDLEAKLMQMEADKEQLELEKHSLLNKIKVAGVNASDVDALREKIRQLQEAAPTPQENSAEIESLKSQLQQSESQIAELNAQIESQNAQIATLTDACEAAKVKDAMGNNMLNDLQKRASESQAEAQGAQEEIMRLNTELAQRDAQISDLNHAIEEKDARIQEDDETLEAIHEIIGQMDQFEMIKSRLEERVRQLREQLREAQRENDTLRTTIKNNLYAHAQEEKSLRDQIEALRSQ